MVGTAEHADLSDFRRAVVLEVAARLAERVPPASPPPEPTVGDVWLDGDPEPRSDGELAALRYASLASQPRAPWIVSPTALQGAHCALETLRAHAARLAEAGQASDEPSTEQAALRRAFYDPLATRLDTLAALEALWQVVRCDLAPAARRALLLEFDGVLGLGLAAATGPALHDLPPASLALIEERNAARGRRDWARSDGLREQLAALGVEVQDSREGSVYRRVVPADGQS